VIFPHLPSQGPGTLYPVKQGIAEHKGSLGFDSECISLYTWC
jgi:hypothetical protein